MPIYKILSIGCFLLFFGCKASNSQGQKGEEHAYTNALAGESSPYLLQHAHNPVDWNPWGAEALKRAKEENKMLIISVGYAACHWCHVMEHESFEDTAVARVMNEHFIPIKVDREERPDVDDVYMTACHMATGKNCGWPLNAFALPDGRPVWAGTYFPKKQWVEILEYFVNLRQDNPEKLEEYATQLTEGIQSAEKIDISTGEANFSASKLEGIASAFLNNIDFRKGGRKGSPKFPMPNNYEFLLNYHHRTGNEDALRAVLTTLDNMAFGGIYDHLGGGFARYSTDENWLVPHFEKMLYDNGQLVSLYAKAYQLTKKPLYKKVVEETLEFTKRELTSAEGGFFSSLDADSEGEEGKFYVWTQAEIDSILADDQVSKIFSDYYSVEKNGNWEDTNILHRKQEAEKVAKKYDLEVAQLDEIIAKAKEKLFKARSKRIRPGLDDKVLTSWNALMLKGYADAYRTFGKAEYLEAARNNANFISKKMMQKDSRLNRNYKDGKSVINAFLDDYALSIQAFISLYEVTFEEEWLQKANNLAVYAIDHFHDTSTSMFHYTSKDDPPLIARKKELGDNVIPGSNSSMARSLFSLGLYLYNNEYLEMAKQMMANMEETITGTDQPNFYSNWCQLYYDLVKPPYEIAIVGDNYEKLRKEMMQGFFPNAIFLGGEKEGSLELLKDKLQEGETYIYVCQNKVCKFPVQQVDKAVELMVD